MKYAVIESGGKQYIAREGETVEVDRLSTEVGSEIMFDAVLLLSNEGKVEVGTPYLSGVQVKGTVAAQVKGRKILVFKYKPKERYRVRRGHRQLYTRVVVDSISMKKSASKESKEPAADN